MESVFLAIPIGIALSAPIIKKIKKKWLKKKLKKNIKKFNEKIELYKQFLKINELPENQLIKELDEKVRAISTSEFGKTADKHNSVLKILKRLKEVEKQVQNAFNRKKEREIRQTENDLLKKLRSKKTIVENTTEKHDIRREIKLLREEEGIINTEREDIINNYRDIYSF